MTPEKNTASLKKQTYDLWLWSSHPAKQHSLTFSTVTHAAADALKAAAGFEADGPNSWKASLQNLKKVDIARVIGEIPNKALEEVDGKALRA